jgi:tripartite-type tricarboxylate transporter receptor subunit TctC
VDKITLILSVEEVKKILAGLAEKPYKQVSDLIDKIKEQLTKKKES